jgi:hypothetical protein
LPAIGYRRLVVYEPDDEDEAAVFWREQARLPLFKRSVLWWSEVAISNFVAVLIGLAVLWLLLYGLVAAVETLIG